MVILQQSKISKRQGSKQPILAGYVSFLIAKNRTLWRVNSYTVLHFLPILIACPCKYNRMPKTPSSKLFDLIKSLTGSEKRYFRLFVNARGGDKTSKYLRLFEAIGQQETYDDEALKESIYAGQPIHSRKFSELKAYLYELVLKSLQSYDEKSSVEYKLKGLLLSVKALHKRAHYAEARDLLHKAMKLAGQYELFGKMIEILSWKKKIAYAEADISYLDKRLEDIEAQEVEYLEHLKNIAAYKNMFYRLIVSIRKDSLLRDDEKVARLKRFVDHPLLNTIDKARSFRAQVLYYRIYSLYYFSTLQYQKLYELGNTLLNLMESHPHFLKEDVTDYISTLGNHSACCGLLNKYDEVNACLEKFQKIQPKTLHDELRIHMEYYTKKFSLCIFKGNFEEGLAILKIHQKAARRFDTRLFERGRFYFQYFYIYFGMGDYDQALHYLNHWLNLPRSIERQDLQSLARILNLIIHFEMGNQMLLEYLLRATHRYLQSRNREHAFEKLVLHFIRDSGKYSSSKALRSGFVQLKKDFEALAEIPSEKVIFQYFDFIAWAESKIQNKSFAEAVRDRYLNRFR